jgi:hypothetical protein
MESTIALTWFGIAACVVHSGTFSGLNLALFGISALALGIRGRDPLQRRETQVRRRLVDAFPGADALPEVASARHPPPGDTLRTCAASSFAYLVPHNQGEDRNHTKGMVG